MNRYRAMFDRLNELGQGAFIPFTVLIDPDRQRSLAIIKTMIDAGADALELGLAFSDPLADGPTIQKAGLRALRNGATVGAAFSLIEEIRKAYSSIPIGILVYANLVFKHGREEFYRRAKGCGIDSVLIADAPLIEIEEYSGWAQAHNVDQVLIAPANLPTARISDIARLGGGYTYLVTRSGVTGADTELMLSHQQLIAELKKSGAPPAIFGFGISSPDHVRQALSEGGSGVICGSKIVSIIEDHLLDSQRMISELRRFIEGMKAATRR